MAICTRCPFLLSHLNFAKPLMYFFLKFYPGFPSIYPGSRLTVGISALLVMAVVLYHSLTGQALNDILKLIWLHCFGCSDFLQSINALKNYFCDLSSYFIGTVLIAICWWTKKTSIALTPSA